jgi:hypothetical protein
MATKPPDTIVNVLLILFMAGASFGSAMVNVMNTFNK